MGEQLATEDAPSITDLYRGMGRPSSLTPPLISRLTERLTPGTYPLVAARAVGIPERTFQRWLAQGDADEKAGNDSIYAQMWRAIDAKDALGECELIDAAASGKMGWQGPMTVASRRHRARWEDKESDGHSPKVIVQIGAGAGDVQVGILVQSPSSSTFALESSTVSADSHSLSGAHGSDNRDYVETTRTA